MRACLLGLCEGLCEGPCAVQGPLGQVLRAHWWLQLTIVGSILRSPLAFLSASLCLLVGAFNPFTFKVIIDMYVPIPIFLNVLGLLL